MLIAPTHLETLPVPALEDISAMDSTAQVTLHYTNDILMFYCYSAPTTTTTTTTTTTKSSSSSSSSSNSNGGGGGGGGCGS